MSRHFLIVALAMAVVSARAMAYEGCKALPLNQYLAKQGSTPFDRMCQSSANPIEAAEGIFFGLARSQRKKNNECAQRAIRMLRERDADQKPLAKRLLKAVDDASQKIEGLRKDLSRLTAERGRMTLPTDLERIKVNDQQQADLKDEIEKAYNTVYLGSTTQMRELIDSFQTNAKGKSFFTQYDLFESALRKIQQPIVLQSNHMEETKDEEPHGELKTSLVKDLDLVAAIKDSVPEESREFISTVHCHLDAKYGYQKEINEGRASFAFGVASMAIPIGAGFTLFRHLGPKLAIGVGRLIQGAEAVSYVGSSVLGFAAFQDEIARACSPYSRDLKVATVENCAASDEGAEKFIIQNLDRQDCLATLARQAITAIAPSAVSRVALGIKARAAFKELIRNEGAADSILKYSADSYVRLTKHVDSIAKPLTKLQKSGDPHGEFMRKIGVVAGRVISPSKVLSAVDNEIRQIIKSGRLKEDEVLLPVRGYHGYDKDGGYTLYGSTANVPEGAVPADILLPIRGFWEFVGEGMFPVGEARGDTSFRKHPTGPPFFHDLSHFSGFIRDPEYMKALREVAPQVARLSDMELQAASTRFFYTTESISAFPPGSTEKLKGFIQSVKPNAKTKTDPLSAAEYQTMLGKKTDDELKELWRRTESEVPSMQSYGGLSSDKVSRTSVEASLDLAPLEEVYRGGKAAETLQKRYDRSQMISVLKDRLSIIDHLQESNAGQMVREIVHWDPNSKVRKLFCDSGIGEDRLKAFCVP